jgi:transposase
MRRAVEGIDRGQTILLRECLEDWIDEHNPVRVVDVFVEELDLAELGFGGVDPEATGRLSYHSSILLKLYIYGYLNRVQSSRRLIDECRQADVPKYRENCAMQHLSLSRMRRRKSRSYFEKFGGLGPGDLGRRTWAGGLGHADSGRRTWIGGLGSVDLDRCVILAQRLA